MEVSAKVHKIFKCANIQNCFFFLRWKCWWCVGEVAVNRKNYQGCQFDVYFTQCQTSRDVLGNYFQQV